MNRVKELWFKIKYRTYLNTIPITGTTTVTSFSICSGKVIRVSDALLLNNQSVTVVATDPTNSTCTVVPTVKFGQKCP